MKTLFRIIRNYPAIRTLFLLLPGLFVYPYGALSQGAIHGKVVSLETGETLPGAHVVIEHGSNVIADVTDPDGNFRLRPLDAGTYTLTVSFTGYQEVEVQDISVYPDEITRLEEVELAYGRDLDPVVITWERPLIDEAGRMTQALDSKDFQTMPTRGDIKATLTTISTDLVINENTREMHFRGSRADDFIYIIDGVKQRGGEPYIPSAAIESITVYAGGVPAQYGDFTGGVIVIETKSYLSAGR